MQAATTKEQRRSVFQAYNLTVVGVALAWYGVTGLLTVKVFQLCAIALPGTVVGAWLGARCYRRLSDKRFHEVVLTLLGVSGLMLVWAQL